MKIQKFILPDRIFRSIPGLSAGKALAFDVDVPNQKHRWRTRPSVPLDKE
jgi:hypothetical protein